MTAVRILLSIVLQFDGMITLEKHGLGINFHDARIAKQKFLVNGCKKRIKTLTESEGLGNKESFDNPDVSSNTAKIPEINAMAIDGGWTVALNETKLSSYGYIRY